MSRTVETLRAIAAEEIPEATKMRMLIAAFAAANWVGIMMLLLVVGDLTPARVAIQFATLVSGLVMGAYFVCSKAPAIARAVLAVFAPLSAKH